MTHSTRELFASDNLDILTRVASGSVALAYLDPPFNSGRNYEAQVASSATNRGRRYAFRDSWSGSSTAGLEEDLVPPSVSAFLKSLHHAAADGLSTYLMMMAPRLAEVHRVLRPDGSVYVHCDPSGSHYLKILMDLIFGRENFRSEVVWKRTHAHSSSRRYGPIHDTLLFYSKGPRYTWNPEFSDYSQVYLANHFRHQDSHGQYQLITCTAPGDRTGTLAHYEWHGQYPPAGRHWAWKREQMDEFMRQGRIVLSSNGVPRLKRYVDDGAGVALQDIWLDINRLDAHSTERTGYDTQKPLALMKRIIGVSSNPGDLILDPFCGTGTTMVAAEELNRQWIGVDSSLVAASLALSRVRQSANLAAVRVEGFPMDVPSARALLRSDPQAFGLWATSLLASTADKESSTPTVTAGAGRVRGRRAVDLLSWVPLASRVSMAKTQPMGKRLAKVGLLVAYGNNHHLAADALTARLGIPVHAVDLESLVTTESRITGIAQEVANVARA
ncbi:MAG: site-specific DNA-methyltransferase [Chloroflexi bacterium HGW-Chloroflexi-9]|nr:MAG: site-specific DNA-methyltransferase [Chloroflexi bacterium HGW-Chloroflexi-9]